MIPSKTGPVPAYDTGQPDTPIEAPTEVEEEDPTESVGGIPEGDSAESIPQAEDPVFNTTSVMQIDITLSDAAYASLLSAPDVFVEGSVSANGHTWDPVGVRLKGSASWQPISQKPNWKLKFEDYADAAFYGYDRLTLNNNVWDASMMAQDLAYRFFADAGVPSPRTGYAWVTLNLSLIHI